MSRSKISPEISEICRRSSVISYLERKGIPIIHAGSARKCKCPLPGHEDKTPSFNIWTTPDGTEIFKCFGCDTAGNIITLIAKMEGLTNGDVIRRLSRESGVVLGKYDPSERVEPDPSEIESIFCGEDDTAIVASMLVREFIRSHNGSEDSIDKAMRMYKMIDDFVLHGDEQFCKMKYNHMGIEDLNGVVTYIINFISSYRTKE